ncbi:MAG: hypothetical protein M3R25_00525 [Bacteroidota bacterium]|nr:hypothetical protein [Bacteroidota bacterium]
MSFIYKVSELTIGGDGSDNPVPLTTANYQLSLPELRIPMGTVNVIISIKGTSKSVTGLAVLDPLTEVPLLGPDDDIRAPCPPSCG